MPSWRWQIRNWPEITGRMGISGIVSAGPCGSSPTLEFQNNSTAGLGGLRTAPVLRKAAELSRNGQKRGFDGALL